MRRSGFTLIEVLVAMVLCTTIILAVAPLLASSMGFNAQSRQQGRAVAAAETWLDRYRSGREPLANATYDYGHNFANDTSVPSHVADSAALNTQMSPFRSVITVTQVSTATSSALWQIDAQVFWRQGGQKSVVLSTRISQ